MKKHRGIYDVYCADCGIYLCSAPLNTPTRCNRCGRWTKLEPPGNKGEREAIVSPSS